MSKKMLKFYGEIKIKAGIEGYGYYIQDYESESAFDCDEELKQKFVEARNAMNGFFELLNQRIEENGGDPDDYEA
jgi:hypothetical protein